MSETTWLENAVVKYDEKKFIDGDVCSHDWLHWALEIPPITRVEDSREIQFVLLQRMDAFREYMLIERKICFQNVRGQGYRVVPPGEQAQGAAEEALRLIRRGLEKGEKILTHARINQMTTEEAARHTDTQVKIGGLNRMISRQRRDVLQVFKPKALAAQS